MKADAKILETEEKQDNQYSPEVLQTLWFAYRPYAGSLILFLVIGFIGRIFLLGNANIIGIWVDSLCETSPNYVCKAVPNWFTGFSSQDFLTLMLTGTALGFLMTWLFRVGFSRVSALAVSQLYDEVTYRTSRFPIRFVDTNPVGRIITRFSSDYGNVFRLFGGPFAEFMSIIFDIVGMIFLVGLASPYYLPVIGVIVFFNLGVWRLNRKKLRKARRELSASRSPSIAHFAETAQGASTIRTFNKENSFTHRFNTLDTLFQFHKLRTFRFITFFGLQMNFLTAALLLLTGTLAYSLSSSGLVSVGSVGVAFGFIALSGNTVQMFFEWMAQFEEAMVGVERLNRYLRMDLEQGAKIPSESRFPTVHWKSEEIDLQTSRSAEKSLVEKSSAKVEFQNVWFRYSAEEPWILKDVCFTINPGERWGVVGRTGSGKSSLIQALFRLYPVERGHILLDEQSPRLAPDQSGIDLELYRSSIAYISQDPTLFSGTLRQNLDLMNQHSDAAVISALARVGLTTLATAEGLQKLIEEKGRNLSLGEKQLVCMARCLLQNSKLVILDEATSSVDPKSEELLVRATEEIFHGRTQLIIAHRLSTLDKCDKVLWIHEGHVQEIGSPQDILAKFSRANLDLFSNSSPVTN